jgi:hypothetical protein
MAQPASEGRSNRAGAVTPGATVMICDLNAGS